MNGIGFTDDDFPKMTRCDCCDNVTVEITLPEKLLQQVWEKSLSLRQEGEPPISAWNEYMQHVVDLGFDLDKFIEEEEAKENGE